jgi:hypothetical protein
METLDKHFRDLTRAAFARYGFLQGELAARWPEIAGADLAAISAPDRIRWPRGAAESTRKTGGTLTLRVAPGRALEVSYECPRLIERINQFHGFGAITQIKVVQAASWPGAKPAAALRPAGPVPFQRDIAEIADPDLRAALARLGAGLAAKAHGSPQDK